MVIFGQEFGSDAAGGSCNENILSRKNSAGSVKLPGQIRCFLPDIIILASKSSSICMVIFMPY